MQPAAQTIEILTGENLPSLLLANSKTACFQDSKDRLGESPGLSSGFRRGFPFLEHGVALGGQGFGHRVVSRSGVEQSRRTEWSHKGGILDLRIRL